MSTVSETCDLAASVAHHLDHVNETVYKHVMIITYNCKHLQRVAILQPTVPARILCISAILSCARGCNPTGGHVPSQMPIEEVH